jgi:hypothetical protein
MALRSRRPRPRRHVDRAHERTSLAHEQRAGPRLLVVGALMGLAGWAVLLAVVWGAVHLVRRLLGV